MEQGKQQQSAWFADYYHLQKEILHLIIEKVKTVNLSSNIVRRKIFFIQS